MAPDGDRALPVRRRATELVPVDAAHLVWATQQNNIDWNPWPVRRDDLDHPDELRIDLDPSEGVGWETVREVAMTVRDVLDAHDTPSRRAPCGLR